ncbi:MAG: hypothetical protein ACREFB_19550 [Stellaceae bacterium]
MRCAATLAGRAFQFEIPAPGSYQLIHVSEIRAGNVLTRAWSRSTAIVHGAPLATFVQRNF